PLLGCRAPATAWIASLSLHVALPISLLRFFGGGLALLFLRHIDQQIGQLAGGLFDLSAAAKAQIGLQIDRRALAIAQRPQLPVRSEEHTSELQSRENLVCRLLLEKKK